jgi:drug/metabolite transporter (DMT)-like permease
VGPHGRSILLAAIALVVGVLAYGVASFLQALAGRRSRPGPGRLASRAGLLVHPLVLAGLGLDVVGFAAGAVALRDLPLFFVQGASATSIVVTALLAAVLLRERPERRETLAMPLVLAGLVALALAAQPGSARPLGTGVAIGLIAAAPLLGVLGWLCVRTPGRLPALALTLLAGLSYGSASVLARSLPAVPAGSVIFPGLVVALVAHALLGVALVTTAMGRLPVNTVTSVLFATETAGPAAVGFLLLGDRAAPGYGWLALGGCALLVLGAGLLAHAEPGPAAQASFQEDRPDLPNAVAVPRPRPPAEARAHRPRVVGRHRGPRRVRSG